MENDSKKNKELLLQPRQSPLNPITLWLTTKNSGQNTKTTIKGL